MGHANRPAASTPAPGPENACAQADSRALWAVGGVLAGNRWLTESAGRLGDLDGAKSMKIQVPG